MTVQIGQTYRDNDSRMAGRTLRVVGYTTDHKKAVMETVSNPDDVQRLLDDPDGEPGTRNFDPEDKRGSTTEIAVKRLEGSDFTLLPDPPTVIGPV